MKKINQGLYKLIEYPERGLLLFIPVLTEEKPKLCCLKSDLHDVDKLLTEGLK